MDRYFASLSLYDRAKRVLPCEGAQVLSKAPSRHPMGAYPIYLSHGEGAKVWDVDGNVYVDYVLALGPLILGHNHPKVVDAVVQQTKKGPLFSLETPLTVEVAEMLVEMVPCAEMVRFTASGNAATAAAIRVARTYMGRPVVATTGYHGHGIDWQALEPGRGSAGVPESLRETTVSFDYGDVESLKTVFTEHPGRVAAVILEAARTFEPPTGYLQAVRDLCSKHDAILIFDEVVTGQRWAKGGAQEYYGVIPDLCALGKAMGGSYPLGAVVGRRDIMEAFDQCFVSGTYHGHPISLAAAKATLAIIRDEPVMEHIWRQGARHRQAFDGIMASLGIPAESIGVDVCSVQTFRGDHANTLKSLWLQECALRGVLPGNIQYISYAHTDKDLDYTIEQMGFAAEVLRQALESSEPTKFLHGSSIAVDTYTPAEKKRKKH